MASAMKYLFDNSFDMEDPPAAAGGSPVVVQHYTEQDLIAARAEGFAEGDATGRAAVHDSIEQASLKALTEISAHLSNLGEHVADVRSQTILAAIKVVTAAIHKMVPELARRNAMNEIEHLIRECLEAIYDEPRVVVRAHDSVIAALQGRIDTMAASCGFAGKVVLFGDEQFSESDCRIEWADGGAERNLNEMWKLVDAALARVAESTDAVAPPSPALKS